MQLIRPVSKFTNHELFRRHGMLFKTFDGKLKFALHYPERRGFEHLRLLNATDMGDDLVLTESE